MLGTSANRSSADLEIYEGFVNINSVPVAIKTWGKWIHECLDDVQEIIVLLPGMVGGIPAVYSGMLNKLYKNLDSRIPIWAIGHPGQDESSSMEIPPLKGNEHLYDIHGQIASKSEFIKRYIPPHIKVHLVGHSLGTYTAIKLLKDSEIRDKLQKCYLIFPTIRGRDDGKNLNCSISEVFIWFYTYFGFILKLLCQVPECLKISVFKLFCWVCSTSTDLLDGFLRISKPEVMDKTVYLIKTSIQCIRFKEADIELLEENKKLLKFYYGSKDGWVPLEFYRELKNSIPDIDAEIDTYNIEHGILWKSSSIMAEILSKMVKDNKC